MLRGGHTWQGKRPAEWGEEPINGVRADQRVAWNGKHGVSSLWQFTFFLNMKQGEVMLCSGDRNPLASQQATYSGDTKWARRRRWRQLPGCAGAPMDSPFASCRGQHPRPTSGTSASPHTRLQNTPVCMTLMLAWQQAVADRIGCSGARTQHHRPGVGPAGAGALTGWSPRCWWPGGLSLACPRCLLRVLVCVCVCVLMGSSFKDRSHIALQLTHMTSLDLNHLFKGFISKDSPIVRSWGAGLLTETWRGGRNSTQNIDLR